MRCGPQSRSVADRSEALADRAEESATTVSGVRPQLDELATQTEDLQERLGSFDCGDPDADL